MNYFTALETYYKHLIDSLNEFELESIFKVSRFTSYCFFYQSPAQFYIFILRFSFVTTDHLSFSINF